ncbi:cytochrome P450 [Microdochium bolleyi]|uniref:Cytochrome P450 n=1 Tax=Microdochium bolleyi TaxID=196109 RepID=A0A136J0I5_9PEZI|nr:cytochrome P450 [Microdochium bolleyi]
MALLEGSGVRLLVRGLAALFGIAVVRYFYGGYTDRKRIQQFKAQGIPVLPHSWLWGHLKVMGDFRAVSPSDTNMYEFHRWLKANMSTYFPGETQMPPVVYLDLWPFTGGMALVTDADMIPQFMQKPDLPKYYMVEDFLKPLTGGRDIVSISGPVWKLWRTRFNPSFAPRRVLALLPELMEEVEVFVDLLRQKAGRSTAHGNAWGEMFQLHEKTVNLTFDVILRAAVDIRLREQSRETPSPLIQAMASQIEMMSKTAHGSQFSLGIKMPWDHKVIADNNRVMASYVMPQILTKIKEAEAQIQGNGHSSSSSNDGSSSSSSGSSGSSLADDPEFIDLLISNLKAFLFAGHDTTASTICFMAHELARKPECLRRLRDEHDAVLGPDPARASAVLRESPHLIYQLPYTTAVIKETLRLHPLAATLRRAPEDFKLVAHQKSGAGSGSSGGGVGYPLAGFAGWLSAPLVAVDERHWGPRAHEFLPERWFTTTTTTTAAGAAADEAGPLRPDGGSGSSAVRGDAWAPFSIGPRNCIGMELAMVELRLVSVLTARLFDIEEDWEEWDRLQGEKATPGDKMRGERLYWTGKGTVHPKDGMPVHVRLAAGRRAEE